MLSEGNNDEEIYDLWDTTPLHNYHNNEYNNLFVNLEDGAEGLKPGVNRKLFSSEV